MPSLGRGWKRDSTSTEMRRGDLYLNPDHRLLGEGIREKKSAAADQEKREHIPGRGRALPNNVKRGFSVYFEKGEGITGTGRLPNTVGLS